MKLTYGKKRLSAKEKIEAEELKTRIIVSQNCSCSNCGADLGIENMPDIAHRISKSLNNYRKYGFEVINHPMNLRATCKGNCNDAIGLNPATKPIEAKELVNEILKDLMEG
jgi:hypothetical protein